MVSDTLPAGTTLVSTAAPAGWSCPASGADTTCSGGAMPAADETVTAPAEIAALCKRAAETQAAVELAYRRRDGVETVRVVEPRALRAGLVTAWCRMRQDERTFDLSRILWARPAGGPAAGRGPASDRPGGVPRG